MVEYQYSLQLAPSLRNFKVKKTNPLLINFSCPHCGDSKTNKLKARAYIIEQSNGKFYFYCHNCRRNDPFARFLQFLNPSLYQQYRLEVFKRDPERPMLPDNFKKKKIHFQNIEMLKKLSTLPTHHLARKYVDEREIPTKFHYKLYYCANFYEFLKEIDPEKALTILKADQRLVIPFTDANGTVTSVTARSLTGAEPKYLVVTFDEEALSVFGLDTVDFSKPYYMVEGPIDSMFIDNCLGLGGQHYSDLFESFISPYRDNAVFVYDNEPRNKYTVKAMRKTIKDGYKLVIWPDYVTEKDINDMKQAGVDVDYILQNYQYNGLQADLQLAKWSKL